MVLPTRSATVLLLACTALEHQIAPPWLLWPDPIHRSRGSFGKLHRIKRHTISPDGAGHRRRDEYRLGWVKATH